MTYEFVKHVADNLRFGSYDGKWEVGSSSIKIKDVNSNTYIKLYIESFYQQISYKKIFKSNIFDKYEKSNDFHYFYISVLLHFYFTIIAFNSKSFSSITFVTCSENNSLSTPLVSSICPASKAI